MKRLFTIVVFILSATQLPAQQLEQRIQHFVDSFYAANPKAIGFTLHIEAPDQHISWSYAVGYADTITHQRLSTKQPLLIASNTKPYVSATILQLIGQGKLKLDQPVQSLLSTGTNQLFTDAGYNTHAITLKHLLSHTSGIRDYVDESYFVFIGKNKKYAWTRDEQISRAAKAGQPLAQPGDTFRYADINYVLLTEIIDRSTKKPFYKSMRSLLQYKKMHLDETWFAKLEQAPAKPAACAHQYWDDFGWDTYDLDPSWDLYGGGGMIATEKDMALFFQYLFNGKVIKDKKLLALMYADVPPNLTINYCLGIRKISVAGLPCYNHGGGLGTDVIYIPTLNATVAVAALEASHRPKALDIRNEIVRQLSLLAK